MRCPIAGHLLARSVEGRPALRHFDWSVSNQGWTINRREQREALNLTQQEAATKAKVSVATWRRWEENPEQVKARTAIACERVLDRHAKERAADAETSAEKARFAAAWSDPSKILTPRQAYAIAKVLTSPMC